MVDQTVESVSFTLVVLRDSCCLVECVLLFLQQSHDQYANTFSLMLVNSEFSLRGQSPFIGSFSASGLLSPLQSQKIIFPFSGAGLPLYLLQIGLHV